MSAKADSILRKQASPALIAAGIYAIQLHEKVANKTSLVKSLIPGAIAGAVATTVTAPLDRVKDTMTQFSNQAAEARRQGNDAEAKHLEQTSKNVGSAAKNIYQTQGIKGFYKGTTGSLIKVPIAMGTTFAVADYLKHRMKL
jgi:hypothetical protein